VKVEATRRATEIRLRHAAGFYSGVEHLLAQAVPIVAAALERGETVTAAVRPATERALRTALGSPAGLIVAGERDGVHAGSGQTTAAWRARELRALVDDTGSATVLSEHSPGLDGLDGSFWTELDAAMNVACADLPVSVWCFYPEMPLHLEVLRGARRNHPHLLVGGELRHNPEHRCPRDVLAECPAPAPLLLGPPDLRLSFTPWRLHDVRAAVQEALTAAGYGRARTEDVVLAVNEVATNAVEHGEGEPELCVWMTSEGVVCEVHDHGTLADPLPGLQAPHPADPRGRGLWIARQLCDVLHLWRDAAGTHVRVHAAP
jgi:anti-sigma regulatory factor (Ser/Thr protein kinase)